MDSNCRHAKSEETPITLDEPVINSQECKPQEPLLGSPLGSSSNLSNKEDRIDSEPIEQVSITFLNFKNASTVHLQEESFVPIETEYHVIFLYQRHQRNDLPNSCFSLSFFDCYGEYNRGLVWHAEQNEDIPNIWDDIHIHIIKEANTQMIFVEMTEINRQMTEVYLYKSQISELVSISHVCVDYDGILSIDSRKKILLPLGREVLSKKTVDSTGLYNLCVQSLIQIPKEEGIFYKDSDIGVYLKNPVEMSLPYTLKINKESSNIFPIESNVQNKIVDTGHQGQGISHSDPKQRDFSCQAHILFEEHQSEPLLTKLDGEEKIQGDNNETLKSIADMYSSSLKYLLNKESTDVISHCEDLQESPERKTGEQEEELQLIQNYSIETHIASEYLSGLYARLLNTSEVNEREQKQNQDFTCQVEIIQEQKYRREEPQSSQDAETQTQGEEIQSNLDIAKDKCQNCLINQEIMSKREMPADSGKTSEKEVQTIDYAEYSKANEVEIEPKTQEVERQASDRESTENIEEKVAGEYLSRLYSKVATNAVSSLVKGSSQIKKDINTSSEGYEVGEPILNRSQNKFFNEEKEFSNAEIEIMAVELSNKASNELLGQNESPNLPEDQDNIEDINNCKEEENRSLLGPIESKSVRQTIYQQEAEVRGLANPGIWPSDSFADDVLRKEEDNVDIEGKEATEEPFINKSQGDSLALAKPELASEIETQNQLRNDSSIQDVLSLKHQENQIEYKEADVEEEKYPEIQPEIEGYVEKHDVNNKENRAINTNNDEQKGEDQLPLESEGISCNKREVGNIEIGDSRLQDKFSSTFENDVLIRKENNADTDENYDKGLKILQQDQKADGQLLDIHNFEGNKDERIGLNEMISSGELQCEDNREDKNTLESVIPEREAIYKQKLVRRRQGKSKKELIGILKTVTLSTKAVEEQGLACVKGIPFMNAVVQCFMNSPLFWAYFHRNNYIEDINPMYDVGITRIFGEIVKIAKKRDSGLQSHRNLTFLVKKLKDLILTQKNRESTERIQTNISVFITVFLEALNRELSIKIENDFHSDQEFLSTHKDPVEIQADISWKETIFQSLITDLFFGQLLKYDQSSKLTDSELFCCVSLPIIENFHLEKTLEDFLKAQNTIIFRLPEILIIHLERKHTNSNSDSRHFYLNRRLDLFNFVQGSREEPAKDSEYTLFGIIGQKTKDEDIIYSAECLDIVSQKWYSYDNEEVKLLSAFRETSFEKSFPEVLFYIRSSHLVKHNGKIDFIDKVIWH